MRLADYLSVTAGGAGSGCHGDRCGRPKGSVAKDATKSAIAKLAFVPATAMKQAIAEKSEVDLSKAIGVPRTKDNSPFDLVNKKIGIEVKTLIDAKNSKLTMRKECRLRKIAQARKLGLRMYTIAIDRRQTGEPKFYVASGVGSFRISTMHGVGSIKALKAFIK
jgi:hypothetical protein